MSDSSEQYSRRNRPIYKNTCGGVYGMAFLGAVVYYIQHATTLWLGILGFFKAVFWPAFLVYNLLDFLKM